MKKLVALLLAVIMIAASLPVYAADMTNETPDVLMSGDASSAISELTENLTGDADDADRTDDADTVKNDDGALVGSIEANNDPDSSEILSYNAAEGVGEGESEPEAGEGEDPDEASEPPYFISLEFNKTALSNWTNGATFEPNKLTYELNLKNASTTTLRLTADTEYDSEKYTATAEFTDQSGALKVLPIESKKLTVIEKFAPGDSVLLIKLAEKDGGLETVYTFNVHRPRSTLNTIAKDGFALSLTSRELSKVKFCGYAEGVILVADETGVPTQGTGVSTKNFNYLTRIYDEASFNIIVNAGNEYTHIAYTAERADEAGVFEPYLGATVLEGAKNVSAGFDFGDSKLIKLTFTLVSDADYDANGGFDGAKASVYTLYIEKVKLGELPSVTELVQSEGDFYPALDPECLRYNLVFPYNAALHDKNNTEAKYPSITFKVSDGAAVKVGKSELEADADGHYSFEFAKSALTQTITLTSADGVVSREYTIKTVEKSKYAVPDRVVDFLCIGSQYTNGGNFDVGIYPELTLAGTAKSLGGFGGYITYYYEKPIVNDPNHLYGIDFYVYGNANVDKTTESGCSFFEPAQIYVSEDGEKWYALAGSNHYNDGTLWNYEINYKKSADGTTEWVDNLGNSKRLSFEWPKASNYPLSGFDADELTISGIILPAYDGSLLGESSTVPASDVKWGYADCYANGTIGKAVNPYLDNSDRKLAANGFDLEWAVDDYGVPFDVSGMEFHYIKAVTASNINSFGEKSAEISYVVRADEADAEVGRTKLPESITVSDGISKKVLKLDGGTNVYSLDVGDMKYVSLKADGAADGTNVYFNSKRADGDFTAHGFKVTSAKETLVRVVVQSGDREPQIILLKLSGSAEESDTLIEGVRASVYGAARIAESNDGKNFALSVGYRVDSIEICPTVDDNVEVTVNGESLAASYPLEYGENVFELSASRGALSETAKLTVTRESAPPKSNEITVYLTLLTDEKHGPGGEVHSYAESRSELITLIPKTAYTLKKPATVLDLVETAFGEAGIDFVNESGNYISEIGGLAEFDNGPGSGWMYTVNGIYVRLGVMEQPLDSGDRVVFHYTDDYKLEDDFRDFEGSKRTDEADETEEVTAEEAIAGAQNYLKKQISKPAPGSVGGEWTVFALARSNAEVKSGYYDGYYEKLCDKLKAADGVLSTRKYTEYSRTLLALAALGKDVRDVCGYDLTLPLEETVKVASQGTNGAIFALLALDSQGYGSREAREVYKNAILRAQNKDGGFALAEESNSDIDITAMALCALSPYRYEAEVAAAIERALEYISDSQEKSGGFESYGAENSESAAQVLCALATLGIDVNDERFVKRGHSVLDALLSYHTSDGGFAHTGSTSNIMATEQALYALAAYSRRQAGQSALYKLADVSRNRFVKATGSVEGKLFKDIDTSKYKSEIEALAARGIIDGKSADEFDPEAGITRAEFAAITVRALGLPLDTGKASGFSDVTRDKWFYDYAASARYFGIINGISPTEFDPDGKLDYEAALTMIARCAKLTGLKSEALDTAAYADVSPWARDGAAICVQNGMIDASALNGGDSKQAAAREDIAHMLYVLLDRSGLLN